jgi:hypothetical protein
MKKTRVKKSRDTVPLSNHHSVWKYSLKGPYNCTKCYYQCLRNSDLDFGIITYFIGYYVYREKKSPSFKLPSSFSNFIKKVEMKNDNIYFHPTNLNQN